MLELSGKQKAQLLISLLEDNSSDVLKHLSDETSSALTASLDDVPELDDIQMQEFVTSTLELAREKELLQSDSTDSNDTLDEIVSEDLDNIDDEVNFESDLAFDDDKDVNDQSNEEKEEELVLPANYRSFERIAEELMKQQDQIIAFFFSRTEEPLMSKIKEFLPQDLLERLDAHKVEDNPMSDVVYKKLFDLIVLRTEEDDLKDKEASETSSNPLADLGF